MSKDADGKTWQFNSQAVWVQKAGKCVTSLRILSRQIWLNVESESDAK